MKTVYQFLFLFTLSLVLVSCFGTVEPRIDEELVEYVDRFKAEATARGLNYDDRIAEIDITLAALFSNGVLGQCVNHGSESEKNNSIQIDKTYWDLSSTTDLDKEFVVFHELGHCVLERDHLNTPDLNNICISIMYNGNSTACELDYNPENREEMINELFQ